MTNHLMIDIETLGLKPGSIITEIAAVPFDMEKIHNKKFHVRLDFQDQKSDGGNIDIDTLHWICEHNPSLLVKNTNIRYLGTFEALRQLEFFIEDNNIEYFWANSPNFDMALLEYWMPRNMHYAPWKYNQLMDVRTLKFLDKEYNLELRYKPTHNSLEDAISQAQFVIDIYNSLKPKQ